MLGTIVTLVVGIHDSTHVVRIGTIVLMVSATMCLTDPMQLVWLANALAMQRVQRGVTATVVASMHALQVDMATHSGCEPVTAPDRACLVISARLVRNHQPTHCVASHETLQRHAHCFVQRARLLPTFLVKIITWVVRRVDVAPYLPLC